MDDAAVGQSIEEQKSRKPNPRCHRILQAINLTQYGAPSSRRATHVCQRQLTTIPTLSDLQGRNDRDL